MKAKTIAIALGIAFALLATSVIVATLTYGAWQQGRDYDWTKSSRDQAAGISGVSVGPNDSLHIFSGTTHEWFHSVTSGVSDIWPLSGGGVTGWKQSSHAGAVYYLGSTRTPLTDTKMLQYDTMSGVSNTYLTAELDAAALAALTAHTAGSPWVTVSQYDTQMAASPWVTLSSVTGLAVSAVSPVAVPFTILYAQSGDSVYMHGLPFSFYVSGLSLFVNGTAAAGASVYYWGPGESTFLNNGDALLGSISNGGALVANRTLTGNTLIAAGGTLNTWLKSVPNGTCTWCVTVEGRR